MNEWHKKLADYIDQQIYSNYRLFPNNYIAYDSYYNSSKYTNQYSAEEKALFFELTHQRLKLVNEDRDEALQLWLKMYSTPVSNAGSCEATEIT